MHLPPLQYDCVSCGKSCTDFQVEIAPRDLERIQNSPTTKRLQQSGFHPLQVVGQQVFLEKVDGSRCRFLNDDTHCLLHIEGGLSHKPQTCQDFPFVPVATPDGVFVGASFYCTAIAQSRGRSLSGREAEFGSLLKSLASQSLPSDSQWSLWGPLAVDWSSYLRIEEFCRSALKRDGLNGLIEAAWRLGQTVQTGDPSHLSAAFRTGGLSERSLRELAKTLIPLMESTDEQVSRSIGDAISADLACDSAALGHRVHLVAPSSEIPEWFLEQENRYFEHVLFRKSLLSAPNVLSRACLLGLAGQLLRIYAYSRAAHFQRPLDQEDFFKSVGLLEGRLMLHANGLEPAILDCAQHFVQLPWEPS